MAAVVSRRQTRRHVFQTPAAHRGTTTLLVTASPGRLLRCLVFALLGDGARDMHDVTPCLGTAPCVLGGKRAGRSWSVRSPPSARHHAGSPCGVLSSQCCVPESASGRRFCGSEQASGRAAGAFRRPRETHTVSPPLPRRLAVLDSLMVGVVSARRNPTAAFRCARRAKNSPASVGRQQCRASCGSLRVYRRARR